MKLAEWARRNGVHPQSGFRWSREGTMPVPGRRLACGTIMALIADDVAQGQAVSTPRCRRLIGGPTWTGRVARGAAWATGQDLLLSCVVSEVGSALKGRRKKFLALLSDPGVSTTLPRSTTTWSVT
ncbi:hypothetical protein GCM10007977_091270 [Dactylosporangium sucinum]|uniref:Transposase n=1 Tax=Dactylosporangium sucinum TaxID=1424081 RepID=A0A917X6L6_9ACTN|nr:hypothetical protein GCM10007977_091270 [Dactylosporangium sucinum]